MKNLALSVCLLAALSACSDVTPHHYFSLGHSSKAAQLPPASELKQRVLLIGDTGWPRSPEPVLLSLEATAKLAPSKTRIVFLGDNIYLHGMPPPGSKGRAEAEARLKPQLAAALKSGAKATFIPGNHDRHQGHLQNLHDYVNTHGAGLVDVMPPNPADPGPAAVDVPGLRLIFLDTALMMSQPQTHLNPASPKWLPLLKKQLASAGERKVIVMAHHPVATHGGHGGFVGIWDHLFPAQQLALCGPFRWLPLPGCGTMRALYHRTGWGKNDLRSPLYQRLIAHLDDAFAAHPPLAYVAGHDHNLQVLEHWIVAHGISKPLLQIVSGAGSQTMLTAVTHRSDTLFSHQHTGFMVIDVTKDHQAKLSCVEPTNDGAEPKVLFSSPLPAFKTGF